MKLYVGNLAFETTENDLQDLFEKHGTVNEVHLMMDKMTGKSRGFAFITMNDDTQAAAAKNTPKRAPAPVWRTRTAAPKRCLRAASGASSRL